MNALLFFALFALPFAALADVVPLETSEETTSSAAGAVDTGKEVEIPTIDESEREKLLKELKDSAGGDDRFGMIPSAFHCTFINNLPGQSVCCSFTPLYLLQCYLPQIAVAYNTVAVRPVAVAPVGVGIGIAPMGMGMGVAPMGVPVAGVPFGGVL